MRDITDRVAVLDSRLAEVAVSFSGEFILVYLLSQLGVNGCCPVA